MTPQNFLKCLKNLKVVTDNWQSISYFSRVLEVPLTATLELRKRYKKSDTWSLFEGYTSLLTESKRLEFEYQV